MNKIIVPDSNLLIKFIYPEDDSHQVKAFFKESYSADCKLIAPELFQYEVIKATNYYKCDVDKVIDLIDAFEESYLTFKKPSRAEWKKALEIADSGHAKSGFPSIYDSIYHALAIENDGVFITADRKHYEKSESFGHIAMLADWQLAIDEILQNSSSDIG